MTQEGRLADFGGTPKMVSTTDRCDRMTVCESKLTGAEYLETN